MAAGSGCCDAEGRRVTQWLSLAQNEIFYGLGRSMRGGRWHGAGTLEEAHAVAAVAISALEAREVMIGLRLSVPIADVACYSYTVFAPEGGISLRPYAGCAGGSRVSRDYRVTSRFPYDGAGGPLVE